MKWAQIKGFWQKMLEHVAAEVDRLFTAIAHASIIELAPIQG
jgi:hypothetical protein